MKFGKALAVIIFLVIAALASVLLYLRSKDTVATAFLPGTKLRRVEKHGPLEIYVDLTSTNETPDYAVFEGSQCVVLRENAASNTSETSYFENGFNVLHTKRDKKGHILERTVSYDDGSMGQAYTYIDRHGEGLWDVFLDHRNHRYYVRSNLCWVLSVGNQ